MKLVRAAVFIGGLVCLTIGIWAQSNEGRISGRVTDQTGAVLRNAQITIENVATAVTRVVETNSAGEYSASALEPGFYKISAEAAGFKTTISTPVLLEVSRDIRVDLQLQPGKVMETMEVTAEGQLADTTTTTLNGVLSNKAINELPVQGRDFQNLLELHPGVQRTPGGGFHSVTSNGNRPDDNNFFIDGADDNDAYYGETVVNDAGISGTPASFLPLDAIQEFNTQESPSADYGVKPGVVMNIGIKSGTNDIHGSAYYFGRNAAFDARNYFDPAPSPMSALIMHEFGASFGGPIKKDKWFYFVNYEGIRDKVGNPGLTDSPVTASIGDSEFSVPDAITQCQADAACSPLSLGLSALFLPNPGSTLTADDPAGVNFDFNNVNRGDNLVAKTDFVINPHHVLSARFIYANTDQVEEDTLPLRPEWLSTTSPITQVFGVTLASTFGPAWSNEARFSYNSFDEAIFPVDHNVNPIKYGLNTGVTDPRLFGFPRITPGADFDYMGGNSSWPLETSPSKTYNVSDTASYTHGKHSIQFGGSFRTGDVDYYRAGNGRGRVDFRSLVDFMEGDVRRWRFLYGDPGVNISQKSFGFFVQDDFRVRSNLTLNLGLRYDITNPIKEEHNRLANYDPNSPSGIVQVGQGISSPYPTNYNNLSPRVGVAWDVFGTGKTVFRSGFGIIFEQPSIRTFMFNGGGLNLNPSGVPYVDGNGNLIQPQGTITSFLHIASDGSQINWNQAGPIFPASAGNMCSLVDADGNDNQCDLFAVDQHLKTPYVMNWNFNVQQELNRSTLLQVAYVANHGVKLYSVRDINQVNPTIGDEFDGDSESYGRPLNTNCPVSQGGLGIGGPCFPYIGFLDQLGNKSDSSYNSLQVTLTKRYSHGLYLLAGYTWAHAIDTATSNLAGVPPDSNNYNAERGNGDYDIRNRFTLSVTYDLPSIKSKWQMLEGWEATSIVNLQSGEPYTLGDFGDDISGTGELNDRWNMSGPASNIHWSPSKTIPYINPDADSPPFNTDVDGNVTSGVTPAAQLCVNQAFATGGQAAANQLGGPNGIDIGCYVVGNTVLTPPAPFAQGNMGRNIFRGPAFANWDFSLSKIWKLNERVKVQFRGEVFNILNHSNFDVFTMNTDLSSPSTVGLVVFTPDVAASNPVIGSGGSRHIQLGAKIIW
jgi:Carboxypeptidase regulatory-like domain/TonB dependent receptor